MNRTQPLLPVALAILSIPAPGPAHGALFTLPLDVPVPYDPPAGGAPYDLIDRPDGVYLIRTETGRTLARLPRLDLGAELEGLAGQTLEPGRGIDLPPGVERPEGWPFLLPDLPAGSPAVRDLDGDGRPEVVIALERGEIFVLDADATVRPGWPQALGGRIHHGPRIVDLNEDGRPEILATTENGFAHALGWEAGTELSGWPICLDARNESEQVRAAPAVADIHPHPGLETILVGTLGTVQVFGADGVTLPGWPVRVAPAAGIEQPPAALAHASAGDLEGDGEIEIIVGFNHGVVAAFEADGQPSLGWPRTLPNAVRAGFGPVLAVDLDGGGGLEVVAATDRGLTGPALLCVLRQDGRMVPPWPIELAEAVNGGPAVVDLDGDGTLDVLTASIGGEGRIEARGRNGRYLPGWPRTFPGVSFDSGLVVAELDARPGLEVAALGSAAEYGARSLLYVLASNGETLSGFPIEADGTDGYDGGITATDLDGDGRTDLLVARGGAARLDVYAFPGGGALPWARSDLGNEPVGRPPQPPDPYEIFGPPLTKRPPAGSAGSLGGDLPGELDPGSTFRFLLDADRQVRLSLLDVRGRNLRVFLEAKLPKGFYAVSWDGLDATGAFVPTGVYFFELEVDGEVRRKELVVSLR